MNTSRIKNTSRLLSYLFSAAALFAPIALAGFWVTNGYPFIPFDLEFIPKIPEVPPLADLTPTTKLLGFLISLIPTGINAYIFVRLGQIFRSFETCAFFTKANASRMGKIGKWMLLSALFYPFYTGLLSVALTLSNPIGHRNVTLTIGTAQVYWLLSGLAVLVISSMMEKGRELSDENTCTI